MKVRETRGSSRPGGTGRATAGLAITPAGRTRSRAGSRGPGPEQIRLRDRNGGFARTSTTPPSPLVHAPTSKRRASRYSDIATKAGFGSALRRCSVRIAREAFLRWWRRCRRSPRAPRPRFRYRTRSITRTPSRATLRVGRVPGNAAAEVRETLTPAPGTRRVASPSPRNWSQHSRRAPPELPGARQPPPSATLNRRALARTERRAADERAPSATTTRRHRSGNFAKSLCPQGMSSTATTCAPRRARAEPSRPAPADVENELAARRVNDRPVSQDECQSVSPTALA